MSWGIGFSRNSSEFSKWIRWHQVGRKLILGFWREITRLKGLGWSKEAAKKKNAYSTFNVHTNSLQSKQLYYVNDHIFHPEVSEKSLSIISPYTFIVWLMKMKMNMKRWQVLVNVTLSLVFKPLALKYLKYRLKRQVKASKKSPWNNHMNGLGVHTHKGISDQWLKDKWEI